MIHKLTLNISEALDATLNEVQQLTGLDRGKLISLAIREFIQHAKENPAKYTPAPTKPQKSRDRECLNCHHKWNSPVCMPQQSPAISGEKTEQCPKCNSRNVMSHPVQPTPTKPKPQTKPRPEPWELALEQCNTILSLCDDLPEAADDFALSVSEGVQEMSEWIEENKHVTERQLQSLDNWQSGCERWIR